MVSFNKPHYRNLRAKYKRAGRLFIKSLNLAGLFPLFPPEKYGARQQEFMRALYTGIRADEAEQAAGVLARMLENLEKMQTVEEGLE